MSFRHSVRRGFRLAGSWLMGFILVAVGVPAATAIAQDDAQDQVLRGHLGAVMMGAVTPDGERAITVSADETIRIWDLATGEEVKQLTGHTGPLYALAISGDGRSLVTGAQDNTLRLWDIPQSRPVLWLGGHEAGARGFARSADGRWLVSGAADKSIRIWDAAQLTAADPATLKPETASARREGHQAEVTSVGFRNDGNLIATGDAGGRIVLWSPYVDAPQGQLGLHQGAVSGLAFHANNQYLISTGADGNVGIWQTPPQPPRQFDTVAAPLIDIAVLTNQANAIVAAADNVARLVDLNSGAVAREFPKSETAVTSVTVMPNNTVVAIADEAGNVRLFNVGDAAPRGVIVGHAGTVHDVVFHPDNQTMTSAGADGTVRMWRLAPPVAPLNGHSQPPRAIAASHRSPWFATAGQDNTVRLWHPNGQPLRAMTNHKQPVLALAIRPDDQQIASGDAEGVVWLWDANSGNPLGQLFAHASPLTALAFDRANQSLLTSAQDGTVKLWKLPPTAPRVSTGHSQPIRDLAVTANGQHAITTAADNTIRVWRMADGGEQRRFDAPANFTNALAIRGDGQLAAAGGAGGLLLVWNLVDGGLQFKPFATAGPTLDVAFLPNGKHLLTVDGDQSLRVRQAPDDPAAEAADGSEIQQTVKLPDAGTGTVAVTPDGKWAFTSGAAKVIRVWQLAGDKLAAEQPVRTLSGPQATVTDLSVSSDGRRLAAACEDKQVYVWDAVAAASGQNGAPTHTLEHPVAVRSAAISGDGDWLAAAGDNNDVFLWHLPTGQLAERLAGHTQPVKAVAFTGAERGLLSAGNDNTVRTWTPAIAAVGMTAGQDVGPGQPPAAATALVTLGGDAGFAALTAAGDKVLRWSLGGAPLPPLTPPAGGLQTLATNPDATQLLAANQQGQAFLWTVADGKLQKTLDIGGNITSIGFSQDGSRLAVADGQARTRVFALEPFQLLEEIALTNPAIAVAWSGPDGTQIAAIGEQPQGMLATRSLAAIWDGLPQGATAVAVTPDGARIVAGAGDGQVRQYRTGDGELERTLTGHTGAVTELAVTPNGQQIVSGGSDKTVRQWNLGDGTAVRSLEQPAAIDSVAISNDGLKIAAALDDGRVRVWELATGQLLEELTGHAAGATHARWLSDNLSLASVSADKSIRVSRLAILRAFSLGRPILDMALYNGGSHTLTCTGDQQVVMSDINNGQVPRVFEVPAGELRSVACRADNQRVAAGAADGKVAVWNAGNAELLQTLEVSGAVTSLAWSPDNQKLAVATDQKQLYIFGPPLPPQPAQPGNELVEHQQVATPEIAQRLVFSTDNRSVWATHADGHVGQWAYASPTQLRQFNHGGPVYAVAISHDGKTITSGSSDQTVRIWDATTGQQRAQMSGHVGAVHAVAFSPDESLIVSSGADRTVRLWDVVGGKQLKQLAVLDETKYSVAVHPNGQTVAAGGADRNVHLINLLTGATDRVLEGHDDYIHSVVFNPSGNRLMSYTYAGDLRVWDVASGKELHQQDVGRIGNFASYAPDGIHVMLSNGDGTARIIELPPQAR